MSKTKKIEIVTPKGFIELHGAADGERQMIKVSDIQEVDEVTANSRVRPSYLLEYEKDAKTIIFARRSFGVIETFDEVMEKIRIAQLPQAIIDKNGMKFFGSEV